MFRKKPTMNARSVIVFFLVFLSSVTVTAQKSQITARKQLLKELKKCVNPGANSGCDESSVGKVARLYKKGDVSVLSAIMDVAPRSDGALSEALGDFFSELLCQQTEIFLQAVAHRPQSEQGTLLMLAAVADGGGIGCKEINFLRQKLKRIAQNKKHPLSKLAGRCLVAVNRYNHAK